MKFFKRDDWHLESECKRYTIAKMEGPPTPAAYIVWQRKARKGADGIWHPDMIGKFASSAAAINFLNGRQVEQ